MFKQFQEDRYLYWSVMCAVLQVSLATNYLLWPLAELIYRRRMILLHLQCDQFFINWHIDFSLLRRHPLIRLPTVSISTYPSCANWTYLKKLNSFSTATPERQYAPLICRVMKCDATCGCTTAEHSKRESVPRNWSLIRSEKSFFQYSHLAIYLSLL